MKYRITVRFGAVNPMARLLRAGRPASVNHPNWD